MRHRMTSGLAIRITSLHQIERDDEERTATDRRSRDRRSLGTRVGHDVTRVLEEPGVQLGPRFSFLPAETASESMPGTYLGITLALMIFIRMKREISVHGKAMWLWPFQSHERFFVFPAQPCRRQQGIPMCEKHGISVLLQFTGQTLSRPKCPSSGDLGVPSSEDSGFGSQKRIISQIAAAVAPP